MSSETNDRAQLEAMNAYNIAREWYKNTLANLAGGDAVTHNKNSIIGEYVSDYVVSQETYDRLNKIDAEQINAAKSLMVEITSNCFAGDPDHARIMHDCGISAPVRKKSNTVVVDMKTELIIDDHKFTVKQLQDCTEKMYYVTESTLFGMVGVCDKTVAGLAEKINKLAPEIAALNGDTWQQ